MYEGSHLQLNADVAIIIDNTIDIIAFINDGKSGANVNIFFNNEITEFFFLN